jgi:hypothetical protein
MRRRKRTTMGHHDKRKKERAQARKKEMQKFRESLMKKVTGDGGERDPGATEPLARGADKGHPKAAA